MALLRAQGPRLPPGGLLPPPCTELLSTPGRTFPPDAPYLSQVVPGPRVMMTRHNFRPRDGQHWGPSGTS